MTETTDVQNAQWDQLCEEFKARKDDLDLALAVVNQHYGPMGKGNWEVGNPTREQDEAVEEALEAWRDVRRRMEEFAKNNT